MSTIIMIGPIRFDTESHEVASPGKTARLTPNEATGKLTEGWTDFALKDGNLH